MVETIPLYHKCGKKKGDGDKMTYSQLFRHIDEECTKYGNVHKCPNKCPASTNKKFTKKKLRAHLET
jgi:hypothetical protein